jgi:hypothetical protein
MNLPRLTLALLSTIGALQPAMLNAQPADAVALVSSADEAYERASLAFREHRYPAAYGLFIRLADAGHVPSARLALTMFDHGRALFERDWYASPDQQRRWNALVVNAARQRIAAIDPAAGE